MVPLPLYFTFLVTSLALIAFPGPNVALIVSTSMAHGRRAGLVTVAGTSSAMALQLAVTVSGMSAILAASAAWFSSIRWLGVAYLIYLGLRAWRAPVRHQAETTPPASLAVFVRGILISLTNPKTLFFFGAFLPQFVSTERAVLPQLMQLALTFLALAIALDSSWALVAHRAGLILSGSRRWHNRLQGGLLIGAGLSLAIVRKS
jgi:threonine/homoserine/homoserine lactone efflux protein